MRTFAERRHEARRRTEQRGATVYETRRDWLVGELLIGFVSFAASIACIDGGALSLLLARSANDSPWFWLFALSGAAFIVLSFSENRCRSHRCGRDVLVRYARARLFAHVVNMFAWAMAFLWLFFAQFYVGMVFYLGIPLAITNFVAIVEHAKALWLNPREAGTTSLLHASFTFLRRDG